MMDDYAKKLLKESLIYDVGFGDLTTELIIPKNQKSKAKIVVKEDAVVCGLNFIGSFLKDYNLEHKTFVDEGDIVKKNTNIMEIYGDTKIILTIERTILNFLMHLFGIATKTYSIVKMVRKINKNVKIACTRKTLPMLSMVEKYAVYIGGGDTHRFRLDDMVMIKDNHIEAVGIEKCFEEIKKLSFSKKIEIEVDNLEQLKEVLKHKPDIVLLDNFKPDDIENALNIIDEFENKNKYRPLIEVSGGINEHNVLDYAKYDIDVISMGCLIHSARAIDISLDLFKI
ncbi:carboxylating nicotinate-nucleotide diphosphorylase [Methanothermococcus okinawensis]|uniref:Nicotinate-nucleotide pyrophosphorylase [carboxylating] n=1 Tax=Methanothermococcus okinawensis (strain DSM 14208 / JCM 11175 / IH1) TaxID=647113 RepID=F8AJP4_METOI|nr:carboxylating nicotinate-nucleotide diphosphorylase [Methanothermococcus okinawensis]AEH07241.1 nicotinate-nucleotide pyrophosphorylase [Methanothermococcus okinawensis IH1]